MGAKQGRARELAIAGALAFGLIACGGVTQFNDTTAIKVSGPQLAVPEKKARVEVKRDRIEIKEKIQFDLAKATIKHESDDLLAEIAKVFTDNPQIKKVEIVGHTSGEGADKYNQTLSERRAQAVREHLVAQGIDASRLTAKGMGEAQPIASNDDEAGRELNRRVEFMIVEQDDGAPKAKKKKKTKRGKL